jgi:hypothetical protein
LVYNTAGNYYQYYNGTSWVSVPTGTINYTGTLWTQSGSNIHYTAGSVGIGTSTPAIGFSLDVAGAQRITTNLGGAASSLSVFNNASERFRVQEDGSVLFNAWSSFDVNAGLTALGGRSATNAVSIRANDIYNTANSARTVLKVANNVGLASGTNDIRMLTIDPDISNLGGTTTLRGLYYNPTLTNVVGTTHRAIETTTGDVILGSTSGNVGIGVTTPAARLDVAGSARINSNISGTGSSFSVFYSSNERFRIQENGPVLFNTWNGFTNSMALGINGGRDAASAVTIQCLNVYDQLNVTRSVLRVANSVSLPGGGTTTDIRMLTIDPTIANVGGTSTVRGIYYNPTVTNLIGTTHRAIETVRGDVIFGSTSGSVAVGTATPNASARLQVDSTTQGFLPPRMTTSQRNLISSPAAGLIIYNTDTNKHQGWNGTTWNDFY